MSFAAELEKHVERATTSTTEKMKTVTIDHDQVLGLNSRKKVRTTVTIDETRSPVSIGNDIWAAFAYWPRPTRVALSRAAIAALGVTAKLPASS